MRSSRRECSTCTTAQSQQWAVNGKPWQGSCDINLTDARPLTRADWGVPCDPWNADLDRSHVTAYDPETYLFSSTADEQGHDLDFSWTVASGWTCPPEQRSASGCGDFRSDTRGAVCEKKVYVARGVR